MRGEARTARQAGQTGPAPVNTRRRNTGTNARSGELARLGLAAPCMYPQPANQSPALLRSPPTRSSSTARGT